MASPSTACSSSRPKRHTCDATDKKVFIGNVEPFKPTTQEYSKVARYYEKLNNNNCAFNGRNLSDNKPVTQFMNLKLQGGKRSEVLQKQKYADELENM